MASRHVALMACFALLSIHHPASADEQADARAIVERAIEAAGGRAVLARYKKPLLRVSEGTLPGRQGLPTAFEIKVITLLPDKIRTDQKMANGGTFAIVFDGNKGWTNQTGTAAGPVLGARVQQPKVGPQEMDEAAIQRTRHVTLYAEWLATLLPLLDEDGFAIKKLDDLVIDGRPAVGISVTRQDRPDIRLYFDKETFALVARKIIVNDRSLERYYHNYAELDGLKYAGLIEDHANGKKQIEMRTKEFRFLDDVEEGTFDKPPQAAEPPASKAE